MKNRTSKHDLFSVKVVCDPLFFYNFRKFCHEPYSTDPTLFCDINTQELAGVQAILAVIRSVATHDDMARIAICENRNWASVNTLLSLVSCSIDVSLKTDLLLTLSALGKSTETALPLWFSLEASQIIETIPSTNALNTVLRDIEREMDKAESRSETYPLTQAILKLLYTLSSTILPPYIKFVLESIFLKFHNRYA